MTSCRTTFFISSVPTLAQDIILGSRQAPAHQSANSTRSKAYANPSQPGNLSTRRTLSSPTIAVLSYGSWPQQNAVIATNAFC